MGPESGRWHTLFLSGLCLISQTFKLTFMKRLKPEDLPKVLTPELIDILARMADEVPQSLEWHLIFERLKQEDYRKVMDRKIEFQKQEEQ